MVGRGGSERLVQGAHGDLTARVREEVFSSPCGGQPGGGGGVLFYCAS